MSDIKLTQIDQVFFRVEAEPSILAELSDTFTFKVPNAHFMPTYKMKMWDGRIRFLNRINNTIYCGLIKHIEKFANDREYTIEYDWLTTKIDDNDLKEYIQSLQLPFELRDYQFNCFKRGLEQRKTLFISPTASGKSSVIYLLTKHFIDKDSRKALVIVPTLNLISQMTNDFITYAKKYDETREFKTESLIHQIYSGQDKTTNKQIIISTWQSLHRLPPAFFQQFGFVLVDECHMAKANSIKNILVKCTGANWRFGTTGTLNGAQSDSMLIEGLTGPVFQATTTKQLMDTNKLAKLKINCIVLKYQEDQCKIVKEFKYADEIGFIISNEKRNKFIRNLAITQKGMTLVLFQYVEKHGKILYNLIKDKVGTKRKVFYISGETDGEVREEIRNLADKEFAKVKLIFGNSSFYVSWNENIPLSDGSSKKANLLTKNDDISDEWLETKLI